MNLVLGLLLLVSTCDVSYTKSGYRLTSTYKGYIRGTKVKDPENGDHITYFGIPYAVIDELNPFGALKESPPYDTGFAANNSAIVCPQINHVTSEVIGEIDCLRLNIYVPKVATFFEPVPVLLWFRGEELGTQFEGKYLTKHGLIVVVANYRLGPYGFLCLDDPTISGNQGLKDQYAALEWVSQNIPSFGGDRDKITIAGQGVSVELHLYAKRLKMFDKAIIHSGSVFGEEMYIKGDNRAAVKIAKHLGYNTTITGDAVRILAKMNAAAVIKATFELNIKLSPCIEKKFKNASNFVVKDALNLGNDVQNKFTSSKIMIGYTSNECFKLFASKSDEDLDKMDDIFYEKLATHYKLPPRELRNVASIVKAFYLGSKKINKDAVFEMSNFVSDFTINHAVEISISRYISQFGPLAIYKWLFSYTGHENKIRNSVSNAEEIKYLFGFHGRNVTDEQKQVMERMTEMWANFVKFGNPTPANRNVELLPEKWSSVTDDFDSRPYMNIGSSLKLEHNVYHDRIAFWDLFLLNYLRYSTFAGHNYD